MHRTLPRVRAAILAILMACGTARAQPADSASVTEKLIEILVQKGVLPRDQAAALLAQAQAEAKQVKPTPSRAARPPTATAARQKLPPGVPAAVAAAPAAGDAVAVPPGTVRVTYVPQIVQQKIADEVRTQVMDQARAEGWAAPSTVPEWTRRVTVFGDVRLRSQSDLFARGNDPNFVDFNSINNGSPYDITGASGGPPLLNTTANRQLFELRARLGVDATITQGITSEIRFATGSNDSPVSPNQTFGQSGAFAKYALWLDRAYMRAAPTDWAAFYLGRFPNPFWTTDLLYYDDLSFDGAAATINYPIRRNLSAFLTAGAFPVFNTAFDFATTSSPKYSSDDSYLFAVQGGADWKINNTYSVKLGAGYFDYSNVQGKESAPCTLVYASDSCSTDDSRPLFVQFGNTLFPLRDIVQQTNTTNGAQPQYFGLASKFNVLDIHAAFNMALRDNLVATIDGDFVDNLGYNHAAVAASGPVNNFSTNNTYQGGHLGYLARLTVGNPDIAERWDWNASVAYKYLETDAVLDALTDPNFHLGGTNAKGFILTGALGLAHNTALALRYYSATEVSGAPYGVDVVQADVTVRF
jgi:hypothetical protein